MEKIFKNRQEAGRELAEALLQYARDKEVIVLGLPRGGVPIAAEICNLLQVPLDVCLVRKLGVPWNRELAFGAISTGDTLVLNEDVLRMAELEDEEIDGIVQEEKAELERRNRLFRAGKNAPILENKTVIIADDGLATGATMRAAVRAVKANRARKIIVAVPVAARQALDDLKTQADEVVCLSAPVAFQSISQWYETFPQVSDQEVQDILLGSPGSLAA